jgi:hypothetical protein
MILKNYVRNKIKRKEYIHQSRLLLAGVDVSKAKYDTLKPSFHGVSFVFSLGAKSLFSILGIQEPSFHRKKNRKNKNCRNSIE